MFTGQMLFLMQNSVKAVKASQCTGVTIAHITLKSKRSKWQAYTATVFQLLQVQDPILSLADLCIHNACTTSIQWAGLTIRLIRL